MTIHTAVTAFGHPLSGLIIDHACAATRPDRRPGARFRYEPVWKSIPKMDENGTSRRKSFVILRKNYKKSNRVRTTWCPIIPVDDPDTIAEARNRYVVWHTGLLGLAEYFTLGRNLPSPTIGVGATECPWNGLV